MAPSSPPRRTRARSRARALTTTPPGRARRRLLGAWGLGPAPHAPRVSQQPPGQLKREPGPRRSGRGRWALGARQGRARGGEGGGVHCAERRRRSGPSLSVPPPRQQSQWTPRSTRKRLRRLDSGSRKGRRLFIGHGGRGRQAPSSREARCSTLRRRAPRPPAAHGPRAARHEPLWAEDVWRGPRGARPVALQCGSAAGSAARAAPGTRRAPGGEAAARRGAPRLLPAVGPRFLPT